MEIAARDKTDMCFGCGRDNPIGLKLDFRLEEGKAKAEFTPGFTHQSWKGIFHGGLLALCLDEAFGYVLYLQGLKGLTAKMDLRIRRTIRTGEKIFLTAEISRRRRKIIETQARAELEDGTLAAEASALMVLTSQDFGPDR
ncbi:MAG: PaaI family thioesterase [Deltaproteobacteria bacterium]|nr:PaaI family thioesterase [Deltaproteobacteria bacterium]